MTYDRLLAASPYFEVLVRNLYWRNPWLVRRLRSRRRHQKAPAALAGRNPSFNEVLAALAALGADRAQVLVVHSDYRALGATGRSPREIIDGLRELTGPEGTLAMPAFPVLRGDPPPEDWIRGILPGFVQEYNPATSPAWTGAIPNALVKYPEAVRSLHPLNTMVAVGPAAERMMAGNLDSDRPLPCGRQSPWYFCYRQNALIVALGVDMVHSLTMIHVAEDMDEEIWARRGWYRERVFKVVTGKQSAIYVVRERHPKWAMFFAERTLNRDLVREGLLVQRMVSGISVSAMESRRLVDYLSGRNQSGYPYYLVPSGR